MALALQESQRVIAAAHARAAQLGIRVTAAVVDEGGLLLALARMDGAPSLSPQIAEAKAPGAAVRPPGGGASAARAREGPTSPKTAEGWAKRVERRADFRFTAKLWKRFTHERTTAWTTGEVDTMRAGLDPLAGAGKLGALLLQFPWSFRNEEKNREWLRDVSHAFHAYPLIVEIRHMYSNYPAFYR